MSAQRTGMVYLTVVPSEWGNDLKVVKATQSVPSSAPGDAVIVKLTLHVAREAFRALPIDVDVDAGLVAHPVDADVEDATVEEATAWSVPR